MKQMTMEVSSADSERTVLITEPFLELTNMTW